MRRSRGRSGTMIATILTAGSAQGAGFALIEQSASGLGNAYAGAAAVAEDASTVWFNPAGLTHLPHRQLSLAGHVIRPSAEFSGNATDPLGATVSGSRSDDAATTGLVPNLYYSQPLPNGFVFGLGINVPYGLKTEYDPDWVGRYQAIESEVRTLNINPALAYVAMPGLSVGVGLNLQYIEAILTQAIDQRLACLGAGGGASCAAIGGDAAARIEGDDWGHGYNVGLMYEWSQETRIGLTYRSKIKQELEGQASFSAAAGFFQARGVFVPTSVTAGVTLPETASLSVQHVVSDAWTLLADVSWTRWNRFDELRVDFASNQPDSVTTEDWDNSLRYAIGVNYRPNTTWLLRAGAAFDEEPIPSAQRRTPRIPGNDRVWLAVGLNYRMSRAMTADFGYAHLFVDDTPIDHVDANGFRVTGEYANNVDILSAQLNWSF